MNGHGGLSYKFLGAQRLWWFCDLGQFSLVLLPSAVSITVDGAVGLFAIEAPLHILDRLSV